MVDDMPTISLCVIFRDEEEFLPEFLDLVEGQVDELILVDTGSEDDSLKIIHERGHQTHFFKWINHFSKARNHCLSLATGEWLIMLDVDDRIEPKNFEALKAKIICTNRDAIYVPYISLASKDWKNNKTEVKAVQNRLVAFRNHRGFYYRNPIHENIENVVEEMGGTFDFADAPVYHLGYTDELNEIKESRNTHLIKTNFQEDPEEPENILNYCAVHWRDQEVPDLLRKVLNSKSSHQRYHAASRLLYWAEDMQISLPDELELEQTLLQIHARSGLVNLRRGRKFFQESRIDEALESYQIAYEGMQFEILDRRPREEILERLGLLYAMKNDLHLAIQYFREWELSFGRSPGSFHLILKTLFAMKEYVKFVEEIQKPPRNLDEMLPARLEELRKFLSIMKFHGQSEVLETFCNRAGIQSGKV